MSVNALVAAICDAIPEDARDFDVIEALHKVMDTHIGSRRYDIERDTWVDAEDGINEYRVCVCNRIPCECESNEI